MSKSIAPITCKLLSLLMFFGAAAALSACEEDKPAAGCQSDGDCRGDRVCVEGACVDPAENNGEVNNGVENNGVVNNGVVNNGSGCGQDTDCSPDEVCDAGACGQRACAGDPDCGGAARFCYAGLCRAEIDCASDADCGYNDGSCQQGRCIPGCVIDGDCPDPGAQACVQGVCQDRCRQDGDCGRGEICGAGTCGPAECQGVGTQGCPDGERCDNGRCVGFTACNLDEDCPDTERCRDGICEERTRCVGDLQCPDGEQCIDNFCQEIIGCQGRDDCPQGQDCVGERCVPFLCRGAEDCARGEVCEEGVCQAPDDVSAAARVVILTRPQVVAPGAQLQLQAVALDAQGNLLQGQSFVWFTSRPQVVDVGENTGLAVGQPNAGAAQITAQLVGLDTELISAPVTLTNPGAPAPDRDRVVVVDAATGAPIVGAAVQRGQERAVSDEGGVVTYARAVGPQTLHVFAEGYNSLSVVGVTSQDILAPLGASSGSAAIGGATGELDFSDVSSQGEISVGLASASLSEELSGIDLQSLLGDSFATRVSVPGLFDQELPLPGGLVVFGSVFGINLNVKDTYYSRSEGGLKVAWALGGKLNVNEIIGLVSGGGDASALVRTLLPFFEDFDHAVRPITVEEIPRIVDREDVDGDRNTAELVPDYASFPRVDLRPRVRQQLRTQLQAPGFGQFSANNGTFAVVVGGVLNQGIGFVPLGLNAAQDEDNDGTPEPVTLRMAPPHSGLGQGEYAVVALTFDINEFGAGLDGIDLPESYSTVLWRGRNIPANLDLSQPFLDLPRGQWDAPTRQFTMEVVEQADLFRVTFVGAEGSWEVWVPAGEGGFALPQPPEGLPDWSAGAFVRVEAFATRGDIDLDEVATANGSSLSRISVVSESFSRTVLTAP